MEEKKRIEIGDVLDNDLNALNMEYVIKNRSKF